MEADAGKHDFFYSGHDKRDPLRVAIVGCPRLTIGGIQLSAIYLAQKLRTEQMFLSAPNPKSPYTKVGDTCQSATDSQNTTKSGYGMC